MLQGQLQEARNAWQLQVAKKGTAEQPRILDKASKSPLPSPGEVRLFSFVHSLLSTFSPGNPLLSCQRNFNGEVGAESGLLLQHQASETSQSLSFLGTWGRVWASANQATISHKQQQISCCLCGAEGGVGGGCYHTQIMLLKTTRADVLQLGGCEQSCVGIRIRLQEDWVTLWESLGPLGSAWFG